MAPFNPYEPELSKLNSNPNTPSPLSPYSRGETPVSFRTNVNRSKTKRWVEAKQVSYDGNDWGDDEYDEYDDDVPDVSQSNNMNQSTGDIPSALSHSHPHLKQSTMPAMDRSRSMDQVLTVGPDAASRSRSADNNTVDPSARTVPIVRPAEIYKRIRGDSAAARGQPGLATENSSGSGSSGGDYLTKGYPPQEAPLHLPPDTTAEAYPGKENQPGTTSPPTAQNDTPTPGLPDVRRLSGFGTGLMNQPTPAEQENQLHHNPSLGFRSVVHQAFDVPETPTTTIESVGRSNSDSTSVISPIIGNRNQTEGKTPTIVEEPESTTPPRSFKPGHRRDLSVPSPSNSPSRRPMITNNDNIPQSSLAEMSSNIPESPQEQSELPGKDLPAPLKLSGSTSPGPEVSANGIPIIVPSMSTDNSPQDYESDRLRKEIIRSLSRENTPSEDMGAGGSRPQTGRQDSQQDSLIPSEYERYWNENVTSSPVQQHTTQNDSQDLYSSTPLQASAQNPPASPEEARLKTKLKKRFSWEESDSSEEDPASMADLQTIPAASIPDEYPFPSMASPQAETQPEIQPEIQPQTQREIEPVVNGMHEESDGQQANTPEKPKLTIIPPSTVDTQSLSDRHLPEVVDAETVGDNSYLDDNHPTPAAVAAPSAPPSIEPSLQGFRDILGMKSSEDRVQAFNHTREQFGTIDTGLSHWIQMTVHAHPEHADVVQQSTKLTTGEPKRAVTRKFPKLSSLGTFATSSHGDESPSGSGHVRRSSAPLGAMMNKQQVEQRGKELLHSAGVLGGQAGKAAKGLFAKGRNKFKGDKVEP